MSAACAGRRSGGCSSRSSRGRTATSRERSSWSAAVPRTRRRRPRPSTGPSTCSRTSASSATPTGSMVARSSTSGRRASTATCTARLCHRAWEIEADEVAALVRGLRRSRGFHVDLGHLSVVGVCRECRDLSDRPGTARAEGRSGRRLRRQPSRRSGQLARGVPSVVTPRTLDQRALGRALLARQLLLERSEARIVDALEQVGGLQSQYAPSAYVGLWTRLAGFAGRTSPTPSSAARSSRPPSCEPPSTS